MLQSKAQQSSKTTRTYRTTSTLQHCNRHQFNRHPIRRTTTSSGSRFDVKFYLQFRRHSNNSSSSKQQQSKVKEL